MEDDAIRGLTVIKDGTHHLAARQPPKVVAVAAAQGRCGAVVAASKSAHGHGSVRASRCPPSRLAIMIGGRRALLFGFDRPATRQPAFLGHFTVFVLACFVGYMVVWNVKRLRCIRR